CKLDNVTTFGRRLISSEAKVIQVDISETVLGNNQRVTLPIMTDINSFLTAVTTMDDGTMDYGKKHQLWLDKAKVKRKEKWNRIEKEGQREAEQVVVARLIKVLDQLSDENTIFTGDAGNPTPYI